EASELMNKSCNKCVDAEIDRRSRVLLAQHPRPSLISGHDRRYALRKNKNGKTKISIKKSFWPTC
ncbi:MAG: hypothetical protein WDA26_13275, partial [Pusillimonas sp.]